MFQSKYLPLGMMPILAMMMISPMKMSSSKQYRGIAALETSPARLQEKLKALELPLYKSAAEKFNKENKHEVDNSITRDSYIRDLKGFVSLIDEEKDTLAPEIKDQKNVPAAKARIEGEVSAIAKAEKDLEDLKFKKLISDKDEQVITLALKDSKDKLELLLKQVADATLDESIPVALDVKPEEKKEEKVVKREARESKDDSSDSKLLCEFRDQNKAMNEMMTKLLEDQKNVMSMMMSMMQQMMDSQKNQNMLMNNQNLYQYYPQNPMGNWNYQANNSQPGFSSFGGQMPFYAYQGQSLYGNPQPSFNMPMQGQQNQSQSAAASGSWSLRPDQNLQMMDPRMNTMTLTPGNFGMSQGQSSAQGSPQALGNFGMNMTPGMMSPMPQMQMQAQPQMQPQAQPQMQQIPFNVPSTSPQLNMPQQFA